MDMDDVYDVCGSRFPAYKVLAMIFSNGLPTTKSNIVIMNETIQYGSYKCICNENNFVFTSMSFVNLIIFVWSRKGVEPNRPTKKYL